MERMIGRAAAAALVLAATTIASTRAASAQSARGGGAGSASGSRSFGKTTDARDLTTGITVGVYSLAAPGLSISGPDFDGTFSTKLGEGGGLMAAYGFNRTFSAYASLDLAKQATTEHTVPHGTFGLAHFEIGARANIPTGSARTVPYVSASVGNRALAARVTEDDITSDLTMSGHVYVLGAGFEHFMSAHTSLDAGVELANGAFKHFEDFGGPYDMNLNSSTSLRLRVGVNWRP
jgi:outer membrane protein with beta-barrel domain